MAYRFSPWLCSVTIFIFLEVMAAVSASQKNPILDKNHMAMIDGQPRLILGLYENPADDEKLKEAVEAGFNLFHCNADEKALDRVQSFRAKAWINLGSALDLSSDTEQRRRMLLETVSRFKDHPALLIWEGPDEALWNNWYSGDYAFETQEYPAMREAVAGRTDDKGELQNLLQQIRDLKARCLWDEFEAARSEFWQRAGKPVPRPDIRFNDLLERFHRVGDGLTEGIRTVRKADPDHIIWLNHAPRNHLSGLKHYNREADMAGCDIYPIPYNLLNGHSDLVNTRPSSVGDYTDRMREAAPGKACAMVLQGFGWRDLSPAGEREKDPRIGRRPTFGESRFMAYIAIMHGANAIMYWGTAYVKDEETAASETSEQKEKSTQLWRDLLAVARELRALEPAILAPSVKPAPTASVKENSGSNDGQGLRLMLKRVGEDYILFVTNEAIDGLAFTVKNLPASLEGKTLYQLGTREAKAVQNRSFRDGTKSFDVHIYATSKRFETGF